MQFAKTIVYVADVAESLAFFEKAFGLKTRFIEDAGYGEVDTGDTILAFATLKTGDYNLPDGYTATPPQSNQVTFEIALVTDSVEEAFKRAVAAGAEVLQEPTTQPSGQVVSFLRCPDGTFVNLSSPSVD